MRYRQIFNPRWADAAQTRIDCDVDFEEIAEATVPFSAAATDNYAHTTEIYNAVLAGTYGTIADYVAPPVEPDVTPVGWQTEPANDKLTFSYNGVLVGTLDTTGNFVTTGDVTAFGAP